jgi:hypothetical protein
VLEFVFVCIFAILIMVYLVNVCKTRVQILLVWRSSAGYIFLLLKNRIMDIDRQSCTVRILHAKCVDDKLEIREARYV